MDKIFKFNDEYKKSKKRTDLCDKCVAADHSKKMLIQYIDTYNKSMEMKDNMFDAICDYKTINLVQLTTLQSSDSMRNRIQFLSIRALIKRLLDATNPTHFPSLFFNDCTVLRFCACFT